MDGRNGKKKLLFWTGVGICAVVALLLFYPIGTEAVAKPEHQVNSSESNLRSRNGKSVSAKRNFVFFAKRAPKPRAAAL